MKQFWIKKPICCIFNLYAASMLQYAATETFFRWAPLLGLQNWCLVPRHNLPVHIGHTQPGLSKRIIDEVVHMLKSPRTYNYFPSLPYYVFLYDFLHVSLLWSSSSPLSYKICFKKEAGILYHYLICILQLRKLHAVNVKYLFKIVSNCLNLDSCW